MNVIETPSPQPSPHGEMERSRERCSSVGERDSVRGDFAPAILRNKVITRRHHGF